MLRALKLATKATLLLGGTATGLTGGFIIYKAYRPNEEKLNLIIDLKSLVKISKGADPSFQDSLGKPDFTDQVELHRVSSGSFLVNYSVWKRLMCNPVMTLISIFNNVQIHSSEPATMTEMIINRSFNKNTFNVIPNGLPTKVYVGPRTIDSNPDYKVESDNFYEMNPHQSKYDMGMPKLFVMVMKWNLFGTK